MYKILKSICFLDKQDETDSNDEDDEDEDGQEPFYRKESLKVSNKRSIIMYILTIIYKYKYKYESINLEDTIFIIKLQ